MKTMSIVSSMPNIKADTTKTRYNLWCTVVRCALLAVNFRIVWAKWMPVSMVYDNKHGRKG